MFKKFIVFASLLAVAMGGKPHKHHHGTKVQTKTVTVTETVANTKGGNVGTPIMYITKTLDCQPTNQPTNQPTIQPTNQPTDNDDDDDIDSQTECLSYFNKFRASQNLPEFAQASQEQVDCANKAAINDAQRGYHNSFYQRMCPNAASQNECMNGVNGGGLKNCIDAYISEGPPGTQGAYPEQNHGHWIAMAGPYKSIACGTDGRGFFTHNFYN
jgi:hypothetical protein